MVLQLHERFPVFGIKYIVLVAEQKLHEEADRVREDFRVETFEDSAFIFVVVFPGCGLAFLKFLMMVRSRHPKICIYVCVNGDTYS